MSPLNGPSGSEAYVTEPALRHWQAARAYQDLRLVLTAFPPARWRFIARLRYQLSLRRLDDLARRAGVDVGDR